MSLPDIDHLLATLEQQLNHYLQHHGISNPLLIGIRTGGVWIAEELQRRLSLSGDMGVLDISFYRDDFTRKGLHPQVKGSQLPDSIEDRDIILIDDVIKSGRTIRAAMNELFDYGRPARIALVTLLDVGQRELPVQPDVCAHSMALASKQVIKLSGPEPLLLTVS
ncbi:bifunctional pyr operon transcriptional regulator/uracil phosphoribosyltransferase [Bacterioplanes sanyensis]|uniref:Bifunctional pyr operon transcriptional regulator/uracil phosphoribosyltransferase n=1 Tax=Bacterioplanes sanyensis TaxID=1249553 RepID=A0A222FHC8_9GAMM|nr:bifunctional pyr operon transcriptional regulator/uracil phosphoribosyltransferase PyrR [Bacterioplanes sanyensis]ASP38169.1 bifunctional pyr operon transcriptional regulator/uracil phosphoribosyltransferase [Bacterioplanes sanyensis]